MQKNVERCESHLGLMSNTETSTYRRRAECKRSLRDKFVDSRSPERSPFRLVHLAPLPAGSIPKQSLGTRSGRTLTSDFGLPTSDIEFATNFGSLVRRRLPTMTGE